MYTKSFNLINSGAYIGTKKNNWTPESERFVVGYKNSISIYNVAISSFLFLRAVNFVSNSILSGGRGFFFGLSNAAGIPVDTAIGYCNLDQVVTKKNWRGGYITNTKFFRSSILNGQKKFSFVVSFKFDYTNFPVISEASRIKLPLVIPVDGNSTVSNFMYPIPSNSTGFGIIQIYANEFSTAVFRGIWQRVELSLRIRKSNLLTPSTGNTKFNNNRKKDFFGSNKQQHENVGRRWNRTTAVSFSGLNSTIELSPYLKLLCQNFSNPSLF